jgi:hypothetical protein
MIESTLRQRFENAYRQSIGNMPLFFETMEKVAREHLTEELFREASGLFDPNTVLNTEKDEYQRGVAELVQRFTGSDDLDDVAQIISERTGVYRVTDQDFALSPGGGSIYIGPFDVAVAYVKQECEWEVKQTDDGKKVHVELDKGNCWGTSDTPEMAWRYAIAAELYGSGDTFEPFLLQVWKR